MTLRIDQPEQGSDIVVTTCTEGWPDADGVIESFDVALPAFERGCYYAPFQRHDPPGLAIPGFPNGANRVQALPFTSVAELEKRGFFLLIKINSTLFAAILPLVGDDTMAWFAPDGDQLKLSFGTLGTQSVNGPKPVLAWTYADTAYEACLQTWRRAVNHPLVNHSTRLRHEKNYPEMFRYLGWCSWEEYGCEISSDNLERATEALLESPVPVRYLLVDDGHLAHEGRQLTRFKPNSKFHADWSCLRRARESDKIRWTGLWLNFNGYWRGVHPRNDLGPLNHHLRPVQLPAGSDEATVESLFPRSEPVDSFAFYDAMVRRARDAGFDFIKVDNQAGNLMHYQGTEQPVRCAVNNSRALEAASSHHMDGLINCMAHNNVCVFNTRSSAVTRCSEDYKLGDLMRARRHLYNSYATLPWLGYTVWGDHDMFHSSDPASGRIMAISKAMSGGPIYLSDAPADIDRATVRPLCYDDGELLRPLAPAAPRPESLFVDPYTDGVPFQAMAPLANRAAAIVAYNLTEPAEAVQGSVTERDYQNAGAMLLPVPEYWQLPDEGLLLYDWHKQTGCRLQDTYDFEITAFGDRLFFLCPIHGRWAVPGRTDKYLSPAAVDLLEATSARLLLRLREGGTLTVWRSDSKTPHSSKGSVRPLGNGLWAVHVEKVTGWQLLELTVA